MKQLQKKFKFLQDKSKVYQYEIDAEMLTPKQIVDQFKQLDRLQLPEYYMSDNEHYWRASNKLVGSTFHKNVLENEDTHDAVFYYSKHCHACKKFGPIFEQIARISMATTSDLIQNRFEDIKFSRINNSLNTVEGGSNFLYTPVFTFYKKGYKKTPFVLRPNYINLGIMEDFFSVTRDLEVDESLMENAFSGEILEQRKVQALDF